VVERTFTLEEANAALAEVEPLVRRMLERHGELERAQERQERMAARITGNGGGIPPQELADAQEAVERSASEIARCIDAIHELGALVKGIEEGLVDFPSERDGEPVLLCWRVGEPEITHWHSPEDGFAGRRLL